MFVKQEEMKQNYGKAQGDECREYERRAKAKLVYIVGGLDVIHGRGMAGNKTRNKSS
jgi:hypothetical protein